MPRLRVARRDNNELPQTERTNRCESKIPPPPSAILSSRPDLLTNPVARPFPSEWSRAISLPNSLVFQARQNSAAPSPPPSPTKKEKEPQRQAATLFQISPLAVRYLAAACFSGVSYSP